MNKNTTYTGLLDVIANSDDYCKGANRKKFQILFSKFLDEISQEYFDEPCTSILSLRLKINKKLKQEDNDTLKILSNLLKKQDLILNRLYQDNSANIKEFVLEYLKPLITKIYNG